MLLVMRRYLFLILLLFPFFSWATLVLRDNLGRAEKGDYIVTAQNKVFTMLLVTRKQPNEMQIDEITIPASRFPGITWREWIKCKAPNNTSWVRYTIDLSNARMKEMYSFTKASAFQVDEANNFLSKLLTLHLEPVPERLRKRVGPRASPGGGDWRPFWQPRMIIDGQAVPGVAFFAYQTHWPRDGSDLSGKAIEIYVPEDSSRYPSYFPYWLQVSGIIGKARVRIIDSGRNLLLPVEQSTQVVNKTPPEQSPLINE